MPTHKNSHKKIKHWK